MFIHILLSILCYLSDYFLENYELISSTHACEHADEPGEPPFLCYKDGVESCLQQCDQLSSCIGFIEHDDSNDDPNCYLIPSDGLCQSEWSQYTQFTIAASSSQVVAGDTFSGYNCNIVIGMDQMS